MDNAHETLLAQYDRVTKFTSKARVKPREPAMNFEESRCKNKSYKCAGTWSRGHKCSAGAIRNHVRDRLRQGHSSTHIVFDLRMEEDMDQADDTALESQVNY